MQPVITESILLFEYAVSHNRFLALPERFPDGSIYPALLNWRGEALDVFAILGGDRRPDCPEEAVDMACVAADLYRAELLEQHMPAPGDSLQEYLGDVREYLRDHGLNDYPTRTPIGVC